MRRIRGWKRSVHVSVALVLLGFSSWPDYRPALPGYQFEFPRDHGNHPEFKLEWWYFTGNLATPEGRRFGYELTFFRSGLEGAQPGRSKWQARDLYPAHFAVSDLEGERFHYFEKLNRTSPGIAGAREGELSVWNENWSARMEESQIRLRAAAGEVSIDFRLEPAKPPVIHGFDGVSQKGSEPGRASHYYSFTRLRTRGRLSTPAGEWEVDGLSWMDHEFGTDQLEPEQVGWDWFSLQLDEGEELMVVQLRRDGGGIDPNSSGTAVASNGEGRHLSLKEFQLIPQAWWESPHTGGRYPVAWGIRIPSLDADLEVRALMDDQELKTARSTGVAYWEGAIRFEGRWRGREVSGYGYLEMTGYAGRFSAI